MNFFLRRHPSASPKIKNYINKFERIANEFQEENQEFHKNTQQLNEQFKTLTHRIKRSLVSRSTLSYKPPRERIFQNYSKPHNVNTFMTDPLSKPSTSATKKGIPPKILQPKKCNPISKTMPLRPIYGAYKYYDSIATHEMKLEEKELMDEIRNYPQLEYEYRTFTEMKKVDPYFHIGGFPREVLLRSPDENVYNHVQSASASINSNYDNEYFCEPIPDYRGEKDDENYYLEKDGEYQENENVNNLNEQPQNQYLINQNEIGEGNNHDLIPNNNNRRLILTR